MALNALLGKPHSGPSTSNVSLANLASPFPENQIAPSCVSHIRHTADSGRLPLYWLSWNVPGFNLYTPSSHASQRLPSLLPNIAFGVYGRPGSPGFGVHRVKRYPSNRNSPFTAPTHK